MFSHKLVPCIDLESNTTDQGRWYKTPTGKWYPSVTTILKDSKSSALSDWRDSIGHAEADEETKRCAARGNEIHNAIEQYLLNKPFDSNTLAYKSMFNQIKLKLNGISDILMLEGALYSDILKIAGRVDCIALYNGTPSIIDFKTSTRFKKTEHIHNYFLQCAAYSLMFSEMYGIHISNYVIIISTEREALSQVFQGDLAPYQLELVNKVLEYHSTHREI